MKKPTRLKILASAALVCASLSGVVLAESVAYEVRPGDVLSRIVAEQYPDYANRQAIMQVILEQNPDAFSQNNINRLIVGKVLNLPDAQDIPGLVRVEPEPAVDASDEDAQQQMEALQTQLGDLQEKLEAAEEAKQALARELEQLKASAPEVDESPEQQGEAPTSAGDAQQIAELEDTIALLEEENAGLKDLLKGYVEADAAAAAGSPVQQGEASTSAGDAEQIAELQDTVALLEDENASLQDMLKGYVEADAAADSASQQQTAAEVTELQAQLEAMQLENENLANDLQQVRAAMTLAEDRAASGSGVLPWVLLGVLGLLTLPLIWLLRHKQDDDLVATVPAPAAGATVAPQERDVASAGEAAATEEAETATVSQAADTGSDDNEEAELKLDIARAYLDLRDSAAAADILQDVLAEGGVRQRQEAREILSFIA